MEICHQLDPDCRMCGRPVYWKKRIFYLNKLWHLDCFRCSRCKIRLNTDSDDDLKFPKACLGEDYALRCGRCDEIFEHKKSLKSKFIKRPDILNGFETRSIDYPNQNFNFENKDDLINLTNKHRCHCVGHQCRRTKRCSINQTDRIRCPINRTDQRCSINRTDQRCSINQTDQRCSIDRTDQRCSFDNAMMERKCSIIGDEKFSNERKQSIATKATSDSLEIYKSAFKDKKSNPDRNPTECSCRGCREYMRDR